MLVGCEKPGPLERAGEEIDEAFEDARKDSSNPPSAAATAIVC
jgi:hypothetical protein